VVPLLERFGRISPGAGGLGMYESIASATGTGSSSTITFSSIPSTYKHLQIRYIAQSDRSGYNDDSLAIEINGDTSSTYYSHSMYAISSSIGISGSSQGGSTEIGTATASGLVSQRVSSGIIDILDYNNTAIKKVFRGFSAYTLAGNNFLKIASGHWPSTSAITSISLISNTNSNWTTNTVISLYGIKGA